MQVLTDFPERLTPGTRVYVGPDHQPLQIEGVRPHRDRLLIKFENIPHREAAGALRNSWVLVPAADRPPLPEGEYYHHELIGLQVITSNGETLGPIQEILQTGANDVFVVRTEAGKELLIPWTEEVIRKIDLVSGEVTVELLPGLG
jgi:16S rRNA processing protein RimM